jgi:hypothetical protein
VIDSYGALTTPAEANEPGEFVFPLRFVATLNRKITIAEGEGNGFGFARIVSIDDMEGNGWQTYGTAGSSFGVAGEFQLYEYIYGPS